MNELDQTGKCCCRNSLKGTAVVSRMNVVVISKSSFSYAMTTKILFHFVTIIVLILFYLLLCKHYHYYSQRARDEPFRALLG
jgi:hypothetical protein